MKFVGYSLPPHNNQGNLMTFLLPLILAALFFATPIAYAQVSVSDPWVRASVPHQKGTGAFMKITAPTDARLVEARSPLAGTAEIHTMTVEGDIMKMRVLPDLPLPGGATVELKPGGYHVMLLDLKAQAKVGDTVPISLVVESANGTRETVEVNAPVRALHEGGGH
jgi:copper(I)-binding protein